MSNQSTINHTIISVLATAITVDRFQGFVSAKSNHFSHELNRNVESNKDVILKVLSADCPDIYAELKPSDFDLESAAELKQFFEELNVMKKITGSEHGFDNSIAQVISSETDVSMFGVSVCASLPNSYRIQHMRDELDTVITQLVTKSTYVGEIGRREKFVARVLDAKRINKIKTIVVLAVTSDAQLLKFTISTHGPNLSELINGKTIEFTANVESHSVGKYTKCKETLIKHVVIHCVA